MPADDTPTGLLLREALRSMPDPAVDLRAARGRLQHRTRGVARRRRLAAIAVTAVLVLIAAAFLVTLRAGDRTVVAARLASDLPIGSLKGVVYYTDPAHGVDGPASFFLNVNRDGTGTYVPPRSRGGDAGSMEWPVRFVGRTPGHVVIMREDARCGEIADLTLDFTVEGNKVTIIAGKVGPCSVWPTIAPTELAGATLTVQQPLDNR